MPAESVIERLKRLEAEESIWPVRVPRGDLRLLLRVAEAACRAVDDNRVESESGLHEAVRALRAGGSDV